jgi:hypothetical protein
LTLRHDYNGSKHVAKVAIEQVKDALASGTTTTRNWINVVGYVKDSTEMTVQATMLWEAGPMKLGDYEQALQARKDNTLTTR